MKILLLSAYDAKSHQYWRKGLVEHIDEHQWSVLTLPARFFSWRIRGNSLTWAFKEKELLSQPFDLIIATSMTDLSSLKGLAPNLANVPSILYFHENQFAYPKSGKEFASVEPQILSIYSALSATAIVFNSEYNRTTFISGVKALLKKLPDQVPKGLVEQLIKKSQVLPVPLQLSLPRQNLSIESDDKLHVVWNHRWEFDKGPELLYQALKKLNEKMHHVVVHIVGQRFNQVPKVFDLIKQEFKEHIGLWGFVEDVNEYNALLKKADVVLSTARHDFQGLAILEAVQQGAIPLVPNRLAYPEYFDEQFLYGNKEHVVEPNDLEHDATEIAAALYKYSNDKQKQQGFFSLEQPIIKQDLRGLHWSNLKKAYQQLIFDASQIM